MKTTGGEVEAGRVRQVCPGAANMSQRCCLSERMYQVL